jgi:hypothetical protein
MPFDMYINTRIIEIRTLYALLKRRIKKNPIYSMTSFEIKEVMS